MAAADGELPARPPLSLFLPPFLLAWELITSEVSAARAPSPPLPPQPVYVRRFVVRPSGFTWSCGSERAGEAESSCLDCGQWPCMSRKRGR